MRSVPTFLDYTKFKGFADDKLKFGKMMISDVDRMETLWEKEKIPVTSIFLLFPILIPEGLKICGKELTIYHAFKL